MNLMNFKTYIYITIIGILSINIECKLDVPVDAMSDAKRSLSRAVEVKSDKYAPEELKNSIEYLYKSHIDIARTDIETAKQNASVSLDFSKKAIEISLPPLARDTLEEARKYYKKAETVHAERYTSEEFMETGRLISEAETLNGGGDYWNSYLKSSASMVSAKKATSKSLAQAPIIKRGVDVIKEQVANMEADRGKEFAPEEINLINKKLYDAFNKTDEELLKYANLTIDDVIGLLETANRKIHKGVANEKIIKAEQIIAAVKASKRYVAFNEDITRAYDLVNKVRQLFQTEMYEVLIPTVDEAMAILEGINNSLIKETDKIYTMITKTKLKISFVNDTDRISRLIDDAVKLKEAGSYEESILRINKADEIIAKINTALIADADKALADIIRSKKTGKNPDADINKAFGLIVESKKSYEAGLYEKSIPAIDEAAVLFDRIEQSSKKIDKTGVKKTGKTNTKPKKGK